MIMLKKSFLFFFTSIFLVSILMPLDAMRLSDVPQQSVAQSLWAHIDEHPLIYRGLSIGTLVSLGYVVYQARQDEKKKRIRDVELLAQLQTKADDIVNKLVKNETISLSEIAKLFNELSQEIQEKIEDACNDFIVAIRRIKTVQNKQAALKTVHEKNKFCTRLLKASALREKKLKKN
jgi:hypothetical protein